MAAGFAGGVLLMQFKTLKALKVVTNVAIGQSRRCVKGDELSFPKATLKTLHVQQVHVIGFGVVLRPQNWLCNECHGGRENARETEWRDAR